MREVSSGQAAREFSEVVNCVRYQSERVAITRHGKRVAVIVPVEDLAQLEARPPRRGR